jgi:hypothetical protein
MPKTVFLSQICVLLTTIVGVNRYFTPAFKITEAQVLEERKCDRPLLLLLMI